MSKKKKDEINISQIATVKVKKGETLLVEVNTDDTQHLQTVASIFTEQIEWSGEPRLIVIGKDKIKVTKVKDSEVKGDE